MSRRSERRAAKRFEQGSSISKIETLAVEDPLTVTMDGVDVFTTMRTPGDDLDLALGWLVSEGAVHTPNDVVSARECRTLYEPAAGSAPAEDDERLLERSAVEVELTTGHAPRPRQGWTSSACGICGVEAVDDVVHRAVPVGDDPAPMVPATVLTELPQRLRENQQVFDRTGGLHAAGLFTLTGELVVLREDVGRHNAVDKVVGWALQQAQLPLDEHVLQLSGRASFELVQKATMAGIPIVAAVSAPSSLAVTLADRAGITLAGFVRNNTMNVYTHPVRVTDG